MKKRVFLDGQALTLSAKAVVGQGGEAVIYKLSEGEALKLYFEPGDDIYQGNPEAQAGAKLRLGENQRKLRAFPADLPGQIVTPQRLAYGDQAQATVAGYTMKLLKGADVLLSYGDRRFREDHGLDHNQAVHVFRHLHELVSDVHQGQVVIGDFNDLNVMVDSQGVTYLVDADSMQFGQFPCRTFTARFVDPLHCEADRLVLKSPHSQASDWYAYTTMLFNVLLFINPYFGGVHRPKIGKPLRDNARVLNRLTVMSPEVIYPKVALPLSCLPDELLDYFVQVYEQDKREVFPMKLLDNLRWTNCASCGLTHARPVCPACSAPGVVKQTVTKRGTVTATRMFQTKGRIMFACYQSGAVRFLYYEGGTYKREDRTVVSSGPLEDVRARIWHGRTVLAKGENVVVIEHDGDRSEFVTEVVGRLPIVDANDSHMYWLDHGRLVRDAKLAPVTIGQVLSGQSLMWVGPKFGFGFYRAGALTRGFVFNARPGSLNDTVPLPVIRGNLIDATTAFTDQLVWFMLTVQDEGVIKRLCFVINGNGELLGRAEAVEGDGSWLGDGIRGRLAMGQYLYAATDQGIIRVSLDGGRLTTDRQFPDTEPFVSSDTQLLPGQGGLTAVSAHEVTLLQIQ